MVFRWCVPCVWLHAVVCVCVFSLSQTLYDMFYTCWPFLLCAFTTLLLLFVSFAPSQENIERWNAIIISLHEREMQQSWSNNNISKSQMENISERSAQVTILDGNSTALFVCSSILRHLRLIQMKRAQQQQQQQQSNRNTSTSASAYSRIHTDFKENYYAAFALFRGGAPEFIHFSLSFVDFIFFRLSGRTAHTHTLTRTASVARCQFNLFLICCDCDCCVQYIFVLLIALIFPSRVWCVYAMTALCRMMMLHLCIIHMRRI